MTGVDIRTQNPANQIWDNLTIKINKDNNPVNKLRAHGFIVLGPWVSRNWRWPITPSSLHPACTYLQIHCWPQPIHFKVSSLQFLSLKTLPPPLSHWKVLLLYAEGYVFLVSKLYMNKTLLPHSRVSWNFCWQKKELCSLQYRNS